MPVYLDDGSTITETAAIVIDDGTDAAAIDEGVPVSYTHSEPTRPY